MGNRHCLEKKLNCNQIFGDLECCLSKSSSKNNLKESFVQELSEHHTKKPHDGKNLDELRFQNFA